MGLGLLLVLCSPGSVLGWLWLALVGLCLLGCLCLAVWLVVRNYPFNRLLKHSLDNLALCQFGVSPVQWCGSGRSSSEGVGVGAIRVHRATAVRVGNTDLCPISR